MEDQTLEAVRWAGDAVEYVDQRLLPHETRVCRACTPEELEEAIRTLAVRGAPCIGVFGAYGVALLRDRITAEDAFQAAVHRLRSARPTAVNLMWAVDRVLAAENMLAEAQAIHEEQRSMDERIANAGAEIVPAGAHILTHCNTGPIATAGGGTALGVIIAAHRAGKRPHVFVDETRPLLQGARLTYFELRREGVDATLLVDAAAAIAMQRKAIDLVIVGADRIARNGDAANKIGSYTLSVLAVAHGVPCYVVAPSSTIDHAIARGDEIPIEERAAGEVAHFAGVRIAPRETAVANPAFDVTPAANITAIVTEAGAHRAPFESSLPPAAR